MKRFLWCVSWVILASVYTLFVCMCFILFGRNSYEAVWALSYVMTLVVSLSAYFVVANNRKDIFK